MEWVLNFQYFFPAKGCNSHPQLPPWPLEKDLGHRLLQTSHEIYITHRNRIVQLLWLAMITGTSVFPRCTFTHPSYLRPRTSRECLPRCSRGKFVLKDFKTVRAKMVVVDFLKRIKSSWLLRLFENKVNEVTKELFQVAPDPLRLSKMSHSEVLRIIRYDPMKEPHGEVEIWFQNPEMNHL